jgi:uncharacterized repeat protein (TIGR03803 family)
MKKAIILLAMAFCLNANAQYTNLFTFGSPASNGATPNGSLTTDGTYLYGMTSAGGTNLYTGHGTIFKIKPDGTGFDTLMLFRGAQGWTPNGSLYYDGTYLYGMTSAGGAGTACSGYPCGNIFKIKPDGTGFDTLYNFRNAYGDIEPTGSLISDGTYLYGMTNGGPPSSKGNIFKIKKDGTGYTNLHAFGSITSDGTQGKGDLYYDGTYLYGMTEYGGTGTACGGTGCGAIFKLKPDGTGYTIIYNFLGSPDGSSGWGSLISDGTFLYGMAYNNGSSSVYGNIFKIKPDGTGYDTLKNFNGTNGGHPSGALTLVGGVLYGMTSADGGTGNNGNIFKINPDGTGFTTLMGFNGGSKGITPWGSLLSVGTCLYGMTSGGGTGMYGTVFSYCGISAGINDLTAINEQINIYPNPTKGIINLTISQFDNLKMNNIEVYNLMGACVHRQIVTSSSCQMDISDLAEGVYNIIVQNSEQRINKKLVIVK